MPEGNRQTTDKMDNESSLKTEKGCTAGIIPAVFFSVTDQSSRCIKNQNGKRKPKKHTVQIKNEREDTIMSELKQSSFYELPGGDIAAPGEPHLACVLLLDTSGSMSGSAIESLNQAVNDFKTQTSLDELAKKRVDLAIVQFNDNACLVQDFTPLSRMEPVRLAAGGGTSMGAGIDLAIDMVKTRNAFYAGMGTPCFKPWIFMITDGAPTDDISKARQRIQEEESKGKYGKLKFWAVGVPGYSKEVLTSLTKRCIALDQADFNGIFNWLSDSMVTISVSQVDQNVSLSPLPTDAQIIPSDW